MPKPLPEPTILWVLTGWRGRLSAQSYRLGAALMLIIQVYVLIQVVGADQENQNEMATVGLFMIVSWIVSLWMLVAMSVKRLHDLEYPGLLAGLLLIPMVSAIFVIALMILPGSQQTNEHGPPPFPEEK